MDGFFEVLPHGAEGGEDAWVVWGGGFVGGGEPDDF